VHDLMTKIYWHAVHATYRPVREFDRILCPSDFMQEALRISASAPSLRHAWDCPWNFPITLA
jgi:hypothetical protein